MRKSPFFGENKNPLLMSRAEQLDRYESHAKHCVSCKEALRSAENIKIVSILFALVPLALKTSRKIRVFGILFYFLTYFLTNRIIRGIRGPVIPGELTSASQFLKK